MGESNFQYWCKGFPRREALRGIWQFMIILSLILNASFLHAQSPMPAGAITKIDSISDSSFEKYSSKIASSKASVDNKLNAYSQKSDSILHLFSEGPDSLKNIVAFDSVTAYQQKLGAIKSKLTHRIDSLKGLNLPDEKLNEKINSLSSMLDSLESNPVTGNIKEAEEKLLSIQSKAEKRIQDVESKVNEKLSLFSKNGANVPGEINLGTESLNLSTPNISMPGVDLNSGLSLSDNPLSNVELPTTDLSLPQTQLPQASDLPLTSPNVKMPEIGGIDKLSDIQSASGKMGEISEQVGGYKEDISNIASGNPEKIEQLAKDLESRLGEMDELTELQKYDDMMKRYQDPEVMKEEALNKAKEGAVNHFIGHEEELKAALEQFAKIRSKIPDPTGVYDMLKKHSNPLKGKPLADRLVAGLYLQIQNKDALLLDLNPNLGYRINGRWMVGVGWNERLAYNFDENEFVKPLHIFGPRMYVQFKLKSNFWLKADVENMSVWEPGISNDVGVRKGVWSYFGGLKKDFQLSKTFWGNVQVLYNLYDPDKQSPYNNRINVRFGFDLPFQKKPKEVAD